MLKNDYQYALMLYREGKDSLGQAAMTVDWSPAREWAEFRALRQGLVRADEAGVVSTVEPLWHSKLGEPYVRGFSVSVGAAGEKASSSDFTTAYFRQLAKQASALFTEKGVLKKGERFKYLVAAFPERRPAATETALKFTTEEVAPDLPLIDASLAEAALASSFQGRGDEDDMPLFVPRRVLDETRALSKAAGPKETGGILIGHLKRDTSAPEIFAEVTAQIPARHTVASLTSLTFTSETWTEVRGALDLRRKGEVMLGWWHSHPVREWCKDCSPESRKACTMAADFFSAHDHALHRTIFPRAYSVALVVNDLPADDATFSMFGWRRGLLESRGFHVSGVAENARAAAVEPEPRQEQQPKRGGASARCYEPALS
jgi:proteasome lid subunit RPN8/RPN11